MMHKAKLPAARLGYRPRTEAELAAGERARAYGAAAQAQALDEGRRNLIRAASADAIEFESSARWVVAMVRSGHERITCEDLTAARIAHWCPTSEERRPPKRGKGVVNIERVIFPGYVFLRLRPVAEAWMGALMAARLTGYIGRDGVPVALSDRDIKLLQSQVKQPQIRHAVRHIREGMEGEVKDGPFTGFRATIRRILGNGSRLETEVVMFGGLAKVEFEIDQLKF